MKRSHKLLSIIKHPLAFLILARFTIMILSQRKKYRRSRLAESILRERMAAGRIAAVPRVYAEQRVN